MAQAIIERESDGMRFEPCFHPGMVRCEACLGLVEPSQVREHVCEEWWDLDARAAEDAAGRGESIFPKRPSLAWRRGM